MMNTKRERKAIYDTANVFNDMGWFFREQPTMDFGIDAFVETSINSRPNGMFFALQIKGGASNFKRNKTGLTFYFNESHKEYWIEVGKIFPIFIILQDPDCNKIYWQLISNETISSTTKHWKLNIPNTNELNANSKEDFNNILKIHYQTNVNQTIKNDLESNIKKEIDLPELQITYINNIVEGVICLIKFRDNEYKFPLSYYPCFGEWDELINEPSSNSPYYDLLIKLEHYITETFHNLRTSDRNKYLIDVLSQVVEPLLKKDGLNGLNELLFNYFNKNSKVPKYSSFIETFEFYNKGYKRKYKIHISYHSIYFQTEKEDFILETYEGKTEELKYLIKNLLLDDIYSFTDKEYWREIFSVVKIEKEAFIPKMLRNWERYWDNLYTEIKEEIGTTVHLDRLKKQSWREFQIFSEGYSNADDIIEFAYSFANMTLYPLAVVTFLKIFDAEACYQEYCEYVFENFEWESISVDDDNPDTPIFYIKILDEKLSIIG